MRKQISFSYLCSITASHSSCKLLRIPGMLVALGNFDLTNAGAKISNKTYKLKSFKLDK